MSVLVTGGAGYIGPHVLGALRARGEDVVVVDDLSTGDRARIGDVALEHGDLAAPDAVDRLRGVLRRHHVDSVVHLAAKKRVDESVQQPLHYYRQNVGGLLALLEAMREEDVRDLVFSSSAAVYGDVDAHRVTEAHPTDPVNPYGRTKLIGEWAVQDAVRAGDLRACSLRYFNVAGAAEVRLADPGVTNLIPIVVSRLSSGRRPAILGADYPTPDGTCVRDFVHVVDLARAHADALDAVRSGEAAPVYNVGTGTGYSVRQVVAAVAGALGVAPEADELDRRPGDPAAVVADVESIAADLGWRARLGLDDIVESAVAGAVRSS